MLLEVGVQRACDEEEGESLLRRVAGRLVDLLEQGALSARDRAEAGDVLGQLGDPRFDPARFHLPRAYRGEPEPLAGFIEIPAGPFVMGSREREDEMGNPERLEIPYRYWIGRYPVTVRQVETFVEAGGYDDETWWTALGWEWRHGRWDSRPEAEALRDWLRSRPAELRGAPVGWDWQRPLANRAVTGVSWFEAMAYCAWLDAQLRASDQELFSIPEGLPGPPAHRGRVGKGRPPCRRPPFPLGGRRLGRGPGQYLR